MSLPSVTGSRGFRLHSRAIDVCLTTHNFHCPPPRFVDMRERHEALLVSMLLHLEFRAAGDW